MFQNLPQTRIQIVVDFELIQPTACAYKDFQGLAVFA